MLAELFISTFNRQLNLGPISLPTIFFYLSIRWFITVCTYDGSAICCTWQQVVHDEQEDCVAQDEGHFEGGTVDAMGRQVEGHDVNEHEERAWDQKVDHVEHWAPLYDHLVNKKAHAV